MNKQAVINTLKKSLVVISTLTTYIVLACYFPNNESLIIFLIFVFGSVYLTYKNEVFQLERKAKRNE